MLSGWANVWPNQIACAVANARAAAKAPPVARPCWSAPCIRRSRLAAVDKVQPVARLKLNSGPLLSFKAQPVARLKLNCGPAQPWTQRSPKSVRAGCSQPGARRGAQGAARGSQGAASGAPEARASATPLYRHALKALKGGQASRENELTYTKQKQ